MNVVCKDIDLPANGECTFGWLYYNGTAWDLDRTVMIDCKGSTKIIEGNGLQRVI